MTNEQLQEVSRLQKLTITKLREEAMAKYHDELKGVHGMSKDEIISAMCKLQNIPLEETKKKTAKTINKTDLKKQLNKIKSEKEKILSAAEGKDPKQLGILRRKIKQIKRTLRRGIAPR